MPLESPAPLRSYNPFVVLVQDLLDERSATVPFPPGETGPSLRSHQALRQRTPVSAPGVLRALRARLHAAALPRQRRVRARSRGQPLHHRLSRLQLPLPHLLLPRPHRLRRRRPAHDRRLLPPRLAAHHAPRLPPQPHPRLARHHARRDPAALDSLTPGATLDLYTWTRRLALRIAMRALFGLDPDGPEARSIDAAALFEQTLSFYSRDYTLRMLRGPSRPGIASRKPPARSRA